MKQTDRHEVVTLLAIIASGVTFIGLILGGTTLSFVGLTMYILPIYVALSGNKYF